jgi:cytoskeletal protein CcmA (bactofilin family)
VDALVDYTVSAQGEQESGSMPVQGTVTVTKSDDENGVLIAGDVYCKGTVEGDVLKIEPQHFRQLTLQGLIDLNVTFEPAKLVDNTLYIIGEASGTVTVAGEQGSFDATINAVATKK